MIKYIKLSLEEREKIYLLQQNKYSIRQIAKQIGRAPSTIKRELDRNCAAIGYLPDSAHKFYLNRRVKQQTKLAKNPRLKAYVIARLKEDKWSPEGISGRLKVHEDIGTISHESIYQFIYSREGQKMKLYANLMYRRPKRQLQYTRINRPVVPEDIRISGRSEVINNRSEFGHFEGDLTFMKGSCSNNIISLLERKSRKTFLIRNDNKASISTISKITKRVKSLPETCVKSMTFDNGGEFKRYAILGLIGVNVYFCNPHSPWQKGSVERMHVFLHKYIPKKSDIRFVTMEMIEKVENKLNNLPRKCLNYLTPNEAWNIYHNESVALEA